MFISIAVLNTYWISVVVGNASVAVEEIGEVWSVSIALPPHTHCLQHTSVAELLQYELIIANEGTLLVVWFDAADKVRTGREHSLHQKVKTLTKVSADCQQFLLTTFTLSNGFSP